MFKSKSQPENLKPQDRAGGATPAESAAGAGSRPDDVEIADVIESSPEAAAIVQQLQAELDEAVEARKRALADFRNYQRRAEESEQRALQTGAMKTVKAILPALDHFDMALAQKADQMSLQQLLQAVRIVRDEFSKALTSQGVERIAPETGELFDPHRHEAVMRQPRPNAAPNTVVNTLQSGFAMGDIVLRPAKVSVVPEAEG